MTDENIPFGLKRLPADTEQYRELMEDACAEEGIPEYVNLLMGIMAAESSGSHVADVMQSSESLGLAPNSLGVEESIQQGVCYFKSLLQKAEALGADLRSTIQAYNFGSGFLNYITRENTGIYTEEFAERYSEIMKQKYQTKVYGNPKYVAAVAKYVSFSNETENQEAYTELMDKALAYEGVPYVFGGTTPLGFDCSGFTQYVYGEIGISLPRTAQAQYYAGVHISQDEAQPGDLIFFCETYKTSAQITHVGIYTGNGMMYAAGSQGVGYTDITSEYWTEHLAGYGRVW